MLKASLIIGFYKRLDQLALIFAALEQQVEKNFEVVVADDGSPKEVTNSLQELIDSSKLSVKHVWHEDDGFRKTKILNQAITVSESPYLIFIDGDCVPDKYFIKDHLTYQKSNRIVVGRRVELSDQLTKIVTVKSVMEGVLGKLRFRVWWDSIFGHSRKAEAGIRIGVKVFNEKWGTYKKGILGCNFSISKRDMLALNGFDERYKYPGVGEDTEIKERAKHAGYRLFKPKFALVQYHLWHKKQSRAYEKENLKLLQETIDQQYIKTPYGINKSQ